MFGLSESFVDNKQLANLLPNIMFGFEAIRLKTNSLSDLIIPQRLCGEWLRTLYFRDYL
jgi:hypothetical protein